MCLRTFVFECVCGYNYKEVTCACSLEEYDMDVYLSINYNTGSLTNLHICACRYAFTHARTHARAFRLTD